MGDHNRATDVQPPPVEAEGDVWAELIHYAKGFGMHALAEEFEALRQFGIDKYGVPLQRGNGRDHETDLRQELLDGVAYARAAGMHNTQVVLMYVLLYGDDGLESVVEFIADEWRRKVAGGASDGQSQR